MKKVFIDGSAGTTGLKIYTRLSERKDLSFIRLSDELRKDPAARKDAMNQADLVFFCLPDAAAVESCSLLDNPDTVIIDTSTAHRIAPDWTYGFAELGGRREAIKTAKRIANPGCHASGFLALVAPLVEKGLLSADAKLSCYSLTGYSGGGNKMIAQYEAEGRDPLLDAPRVYGISQSHKHLPEMTKLAGLNTAPIFSPIVADFFSGMETVVSLFGDEVKGGIKALSEFYADYYQEGLVKFVPQADEGGFLSSCRYAEKDSMEISVQGNEDRILLVSRFDNLGKGACGAAIQNMNLSLGVPELTGLNV